MDLLVKAKNINDRSCLTASNIVEKYASIYPFKVFSVIASSSFCYNPSLPHFAGLSYF